MDEERFDTWTRSELLAARGYDIPSKASPAPATNGSATSRSGTSALTISEARPESPNGSASHTTEEPGAAAGAPVPVAVHGSEISQSGLEALSSPEVLPEATEATNGVAKSHTALQGQTGRSCSECAGALPASHHSGAERLTCSPRCAQRRHNRLRHNRLRNPKESTEMTALQLATLPTDGEGETAVAVPGPNGHAPAPEASVFVTALDLSAVLPAGWCAEVGPACVILSWRAG